MRYWSVTAGLCMAGLVGLTQGDTISQGFWQAFCSTEHPVTRPVLAARSTHSLISPARAAPSNPCQQPASFQSLSEASGTGDLTVPMTIEQGTGAGDAAAMCFVYQSIANPLIRLPQGHRLAVPLTSALSNDDTSGMVNCAMQTFLGGECANPEAGLRARPGPDGTFYPIESVVPMLADGTTNLHTHGFTTSPQPCHDEVIVSTLYPINWGIPPQNLLPCQSAPNELSYTYDIPLDHPAGVYWYHTHRHGQEQVQQMLGASGPIVIEGDEDQRRATRGMTDEVLMVRDQPSPPSAAQPSPMTAGSAHRKRLAGLTAAAATAVPYVTIADAAVDPKIDRIHEVSCAADDPDTGGPPTTHLTLNGALVSEAESGFPADTAVLSKTMAAGSRQVWRLVNGSAQNTISPQLTLVAGGTSTVLPLDIIARDGVPLHDDDGTRRTEIRDSSKNPLLVGTAGRVEFVVHAPPPGATLYLDSQQVAPGCAGDGLPARRLLRVTSTGQGSAPADDSDIAPVGKETQLVNMLGAHPAVQRVMAFTEYPRQFTANTSLWAGGSRPTADQLDATATDFFLNMIQSSDGEAAHVTIHPFSMNAPPDVVVHLNGQPSVVEEWLVQNYTLEIHAFHIHQTHFRDVTNGLDNTAPILDTVVVPPASRSSSPSEPGMDVPGTPGYVKLRMVFTQAAIGTFVFHCHIGEHVDNGMMQKVSVVAD